MTGPRKGLWPEDRARCAAGSVAGDEADAGLLRICVVAARKSKIVPTFAPSGLVSKFETVCCQMAVREGRLGPRHGPRLADVPRPATRIPGGTCDLIHLAILFS